MRPRHCRRRKCLRSNCTDMKISDHAVDRYRERIRDVSVDRARDEMQQCFDAAKDKHKKRVTGRRSTAIVPTGCCIFVFDRGTMVTVLPR